MKTSFVIKNNIYPFDVLISIGQSDEELRKDIYKCVAEDAEGVDKVLGLHRTVRARTVMVSTNQTIIRFIHQPIRPGTIAHEALHAVDFILWKVGLKYSDDSAEAFNYLLDYIVQNIHESIKPHKKMKDPLLTP